MEGRGSGHECDLVRNRELVPRQRYGVPSTREETVLVEGGQGVGTLKFQLSYGGRSL